MLSSIQRWFGENRHSIIKGGLLIAAITAFSWYDATYWYNIPMKDNSLFNNAMNASAIVADQMKASGNYTPLYYLAATMVILAVALCFMMRGFEE